MGREGCHYWLFFLSSVSWFLHTNGSFYIPTILGAEDVIILETPAADKAAQAAAGATKFEFDAVFLPSSTQQQVFEFVRPLAVSVMDGYNATIFAYGQTGSGKTYTMEGGEDKPDGICYATFDELFSIRDQRRESTTFTFSLSMLEIYNETVRDLLSEPKAAAAAAAASSLQIRDSGPGGGENVPGLTKIDVHNARNVAELMKRGHLQRSTGGHAMNARSSRSHSCIRIQVIGMNEEAGTATEARLMLVDLAGSERVSKTDATGPRLKEAQAINKSLSALGNVMQALGTKQKKAPAKGGSGGGGSSGNGREHVPFRDSKLTYLLKDSLTGGSKVMMVVNVSPAEYNHAETLGSLMFASRCRAIELGKAVKNEESSKALMLRREIAKLRQELDTAEKETETTKEKASQLLKRVADAETKARETEGSAEELQAKHAAHVGELTEEKRHLVAQISALEAQSAALKAEQAKALKSAEDKGASERKKAVDQALKQAAKQAKKERKQEAKGASKKSDRSASPAPTEGADESNERSQAIAELGNAQFELACAFDRGKGGVKRSYSEAARWYRKAADSSGHCGALNRLGYFYMKGKGLRASDVEAAKCYIRAANLNDVTAMYTTGFLYSKGKGVAKSDTQAAKYYAMAADRGNAEAQHNLGVLFDEGRGVEQSYTEAAKWYSAAAEQNVSAAQYNLALAFSMGQGVDLSEEKMIHWFERAAELGNTAAQIRLGFLNLGEDGRKVQIETAKVYFRLAAESGSTVAVEQLQKLEGGTRKDDHSDARTSRDSSSTAASPAPEGTRRNPLSPTKIPK